MLIILMFVLPLLSVAAEYFYQQQAVALVPLLLKWFVFWGVGVRLLLAGIRQILQPSFTAQKILGVTDERAFILVRELGFANTSIGILGMASLIFKLWAMPAALVGAIFLGLAGINHTQHPNRNKRQNLAMITDLALAGILIALIVVMTLQSADAIAT